MLHSEMRRYQLRNLHSFVLKKLLVSGGYVHASEDSRFALGIWPSIFRPFRPQLVHSLRPLPFYLVICNCCPLANSLAFCHQEPTMLSIIIDSAYIGCRPECGIAYIPRYTVVGFHSIPHIDVTLQYTSNWYVRNCAAPSTSEPLFGLVGYEVDFLRQVAVRHGGRQGLLGQVTVFIPLNASTAFPSLTTDITELCSASANVQCQSSSIHIIRRLLTSYGYSRDQFQPYDDTNSITASHSLLPNAKVLGLSCRPDNRHREPSTCKLRMWWFRSRCKSQHRLRCCVA